MSVQHRGGAAAVAEVGAEQGALRVRPPQQFRGAGGDEAVAGAVEPVAAHPFVFVQLVRNGVEVDGLRSSYITLLVYLTIINLFLFYYYQFAIILAALYQFVLLLGVLHYQRMYANPAAEDQQLFTGAENADKNG